MATVEKVASIGQDLVDPRQDLSKRFRALFTLRNLGGKTPEPQSFFIFKNWINDKSTRLSNKIAAIHVPSTQDLQ